MKSKLQIITLLLITINIKVFGQNSVELLTKQIIDTTATETQNAYSIYQWITSNIKYDLAAFKKREQLHLTPAELIKRKKGICGDYAELYKAMCKVAGIESYTISGYSKGYMYNPEKPFIKSNHLWNVIFADGNWMHVDATWGSGYIDKRPPTFQKLVAGIIQIAYTNSHTSFNQAPDDFYFNIPLDSLIKTHYPTDPKWLFSNQPLSITMFQEKEVNNYVEYPNHLSEIEAIRRKSSISQFVVEGKNGNKFNDLNYLNLALGYYNKSIGFNLERDISEQNKFQVESYVSELEIVINAINRHKEISDSIYRSRKAHLKQVARDQKRLTGRIKSKAKKAQQTHKSSQKQIVGKNSSYYKKLNGYQLNIGRTEIKKIQPITPKELTYVDTSDVETLINDISAVRLIGPELEQKMDSILAVIDNFAEIDAELDDSIAMANREFKTNIDTLFLMILTGEEKFINGYVDSLKLIYKEIEDFLSDKKSAKSDLQNTGRAFYGYSAQLQRSIKQEMSLNMKLQKLTFGADSVQYAYNTLIDDLILCYKKSMVFTKKLKNHNEIQSAVREENLESLKQQKKSINKENKFFLAWHENLMKQEKEEYDHEKLIVKNIKSFAVRNQKAAETKLNKFVNQE